MVQSEGSGSERPEPPARYDPKRWPAFNRNTGKGKPPLSEVERVRRLCTVSQVLGLVSLVIGGVVLSAAALGVAIASYRAVRANTTSNPAEGQSIWLALRRSSIAAIVIGCVALAANAYALVVIYPTVLEMLQSQIGPASGPASSTWG